MNYLIDGYNLIGKLSHISLSDPKKEQKLIDYLKTHFLKKDKITLVFDGKSPLSTYGSRYKDQHITVIFTAPDESADDWLINKMRSLKEKTNKTVVTSDKDILYEAKKQKIKCIQSENIHSIQPHKKKHEKKISPSKKDTDYWLSKFSNNHA